MRRQKYTSASQVCRRPFIELNRDGYYAHFQRGNTGITLTAEGREFLV